MNNVMPIAYRGMIASPHYLASSVGNRMLQQGGNAFDAAVAVSAALAAVYPHMTGLGGDAFFFSYMTPRSASSAASTAAAVRAVV